MARRGRTRETITSKDVMTVDAALFGDKTDAVGLCPICKKEYQSIEEKPPKTKRKWGASEILSHKLNHIESGKVKRVVATFMELTEDQREESLNFIKKYL